MIIAVANKDAWKDTTSNDRKTAQKIPSVVSPKNSSEASKSVVAIEEPQKETVISQPTKVSLLQIKERTALCDDSSRRQLHRLSKEDF